MSSTITRRRTVPVNVGGVVIGGAAPIPVQARLATPACDWYWPSQGSAGCPTS